MALTLRLVLAICVAAVVSAPRAVNGLEQQKGYQDQSCGWVGGCWCDGSSDVACLQDIQHSRLHLATLLTPQEPGTRLLLLPQTDSPVILVEATHSANRVIERAVVRNTSGRQVTTVTLGRLSIHADGTQEVVVGEPERLERTLHTGETTRLLARPELGSVMQLSERGATTVLTFVAEVRFAAGDYWQADLTKLLEPPPLRG